MSTRAVYTFIDSDSSFHVYKHHDGYPSGAAEFINEASAKAWTLPRFEASDFAAAFVAANKQGGGGVYLTEHYNRHGDLEYRYEVEMKRSDKEPTVRAYGRSGSWADDEATYTLIWTGPLSQVATMAKTAERT